MSDLRAFASDIDMERSLQIEAEIRHDVMAEVRTFAEQCPVGGPVIHLGATSMDIRDNAEVLQLRHALDLLLKKVAPAAYRFSPFRSSAMPPCRPSLSPTCSRLNRPPTATA